MSEGNYSLFGLKVRSEIALPELFAEESERSPDVVICRGKVESTAEPGLQVRNGALVLNVADVARYEIANGASIVVDPFDGAPEKNVRLFLLGSAFGALLHQRGLLPLHANAVEIEGRAVAFMGASGAGKSTLAAWFHDRGHRVIADDVCVVGFDASGMPFAAPGLPRLRLWAEALESMGHDWEAYPRSFAGEAQLDKFDVQVESALAARSDTPLGNLYLLDRGDRFSIEPMSGSEAAEAVFANTYRGAYVSAASAQTAHWQSAVRLVQKRPVFRATRKWGLQDLEAQCERLLAHACLDGSVA